MKSLIACIFILFLCPILAVSFSRDSRIEYLDGVIDIVTKKKYGHPMFVFPEYGIDRDTLLQKITHLKIAAEDTIWVISYPPGFYRRGFSAISQVAKDTILGYPDPEEIEWQLGSLNCQPFLLYMRGDTNTIIKYWMDPEDIELGLGYYIVYRFVVDEKGYKEWDVFKFYGAEDSNKIIFLRKIAEENRQKKLKKKNFDEK